MQRRIIFIIFIFLLIWVVLFSQARLQGEASAIELMLASIIFFICAIPTIIYFSRQEKSLPFLPFFSIFYFIYFGLGVFIQYSLFQIEYLEREIIIKTLNLSIMGIVAFLIGFYSPAVNLFQAFLPKWKLNWYSYRAYRLGIYTGILGLILYYLHSAKKIVILSDRTTSFLIDLNGLGYAILYLLILQKKLKGGGKFLFLIILGLRLLFDLSSGSTSLVAIDLSVIIFLYIYHYKKIPFIYIIIFSIIFNFIFGARDEYRRLTWFGGEYAQGNIFNKGILYLRLVLEQMTSKSGEEKVLLQEDYKKITARANALVTFAKTVTLTPEYIPYWGGYTYSYLYTSLIPRFLYPSKPQKMLGQEFGHRYELLNPNDFSTSYNLPVLVEFYINFGPLGVALGMFILGIIFRILYFIFNNPDMGEAGAIIGTVIFAGLYNLESDLSLMIGSVIHYIILLYLLFKFNLVSIVKTN